MNFKEAGFRAFYHNLVALNQRCTETVIEGLSGCRKRFICAFVWLH